MPEGLLPRIGPILSIPSNNSNQVLSTHRSTTVRLIRLFNISPSPSAPKRQIANQSLHLLLARQPCRLQLFDKLSPLVRSSLSPASYRWFYGSLGIAQKTP